MNRKTISGIMLTLFSIAPLSLAFNIQPAKADPATIIVPDDYPTIQKAIKHSNPGDTIYVQCWLPITERVVVVNKSVKLVGERIEPSHGLPPYPIIWGIFDVRTNNVSISRFATLPPWWPHSGIILDHRNSCRISEMILDVNEGIGIWLRDSYNNVLAYNNVVRLPMEGIILDSSSNNILIGNDLTEGGGITLKQSSGNVLAGNDIENSYRGISLRQSFGNRIHHNNFVNNHRQVDSEESVNIWDSGYPSGGNYWSDYTGNDTYSGLYQNETGSDGIGDTPYIIDEYNRDNYPLMEPWKFEAGHNIAVLDAAPSINDAYAGWIVDMSVTVKNEGDFFEIFDVTAYSNENPIETKTTSLASKENMTLTFGWNTSDVTPGNYTIRAEATIVPDEINVEDNLFVDDVVRIHMLGDIDGDGIVNIYDVVTACVAYGSKEGDSNWNPLADLAPSYGLINIYDIVTITFHFGETYP